ncbi:unnamed protein product [Candidula unifasciata]|uniref:TIR domain-containing protein n=1 Tax=Candidula unifasciata TaxID=100452 RepID=A0A8S3YQN7_9EUPU|nr:unnamed protein product [Candidula unifasciata]
MVGDVGCVCDPRFTGTYCEVPCPLVCDTNRHCEYKEAHQTPECFCNYGYSGYNCSEEISGATSAVGLVASVGLLLLLLLCCVIVPVLLYKRGNIRVMKMVRSFRGYEEDDNKEYDAFILYVSADLDRQFVIQTLVPKLEGRMCLTLCIQQRSLVPTTTTANNTVELARQSRRIILILSPSFIDSSCNSEEYRTTNLQMLQEKRKILLIVLGDIHAAQNKTDDAINRILHSARKLEYPGKQGNQQEYNKFWSRLELSMPKKRPNTLESGKGQSCLVSPSISSSLEPAQDPKAPLEIRQFPNGNLNPQLMQRIVRVPAYNLDASEKTPPVVCAAFDRILGRNDSNDFEIQEKNIDNFGTAKDSYYGQPQPDLPTANGHNGAVNGGFDYSSSRHTNIIQTEALMNGIGQTNTRDGS